MYGRNFIAAVVAFGLCGAHTAQPKFAQEIPKQTITLVVGLFPVAPPRGCASDREEAARQPQTNGAGR